MLAPLVLLEGTGYALRVTLFGLQRFRSIWIVALANNLAKLGIVFMLWRLNEGVVALVAGLVFVQFLTVLVLGGLVLRFLPRESGPIEDVPTQRKIWRYVFPLLGARAFFLSGQHLNRLILGALLPARELGLASFALLTIDRFISLAAAVPNSLLPALSRLRGERRDDTIEQVVTEGYRLVAAISVVVMAGTFCLAREAVWITGGREFLGAILPLQILGLTPLFRTMQQPLSMGFYTYEKTRTVFWLAGLKFAVEPLCYPASDSAVRRSRRRVGEPASPRSPSSVRRFGSPTVSSRGRPESGTGRHSSPGRSGRSSWSSAGRCTAWPNLGPVLPRGSCYSSRRPRRSSPWGASFTGTTSGISPRRAGERAP